MSGIPWAIDWDDVDNEYVIQPADFEEHPNHVCQLTAKSMEEAVDVLYDKVYVNTHLGFRRAPGT